MGLDFGKKEPAAVQPAVQNEIEAVDVYVLVEDRKADEQTSLWVQMRLCTCQHYRGKQP